MSGLEIFGLVVAAIIALIIVAVVAGHQISKFRKRRKAEALEAERKSDYKLLLQLLERAEAGELEATDELGEFSTYHRRLFSQEENRRWYAVRVLLSAKVAYPEELQKLEACRDAYQNTEDAYQRIDTLVSFKRAYGQVHEYNQPKLGVAIGYTQEHVAALLEGAVQAHYKALLARREDPDGFNDLREFIARTRKQRDRYGTYDGDLREAGLDSLPYPEDWNRLVAWHYDTPALDTFADQPERGKGDVRLLAAEAIRTDDFTNAQIALAYCNTHTDYRAAIGDVLTAELAKLVAEHRAAAGKPILEVAGEPADK